MKTLRDELNDCILEMQATSDKMKTLLMRDDIVWPEMEEEFMFDGVSFFKTRPKPDSVCSGCYFQKGYTCKDKDLPCNDMIFIKK